MAAVVFPGGLAVVAANCWLIRAAVFVCTAASNCAPVDTPLELEGDRLNVDHSLAAGCVSNVIGAMPFAPTEIWAASRSVPRTALSNRTPPKTRRIQQPPPPRSMAFMNGLGYLGAAMLATAV